MRVHRYIIKTQDYGDIPILRPLPAEERHGDAMVIDYWGVLAPVRDEAPPLAKLLPVVSGEVFSHALHGFARPLMQVLGPPPQALVKMTPFKACSLKGYCVMYDAKRCIPGKKLPECWTPEGLETAVQRAVALVTMAWAEGRYVLIVEGPEFSLSASNSRTPSGGGRHV